MPPHTPAVAGPLPVCASRDTDAFLKRKRGVTLENALLRFLFYCFFPTPQDAIWDATSYVAGGVGRAVPQTKAPTPKNLCANFPNIPRYFFSIFCTFFMPERASFGIKRPAFTRGYGGGASPHIRTEPLANPRSLYAQKSTMWDATSHVAGGVGRAAPQTKAPTFKNLYAVF